MAEELAESYDLPDLSDFLVNHNEARKAAVDGDTPLPDLDAEYIARKIEDYVDAVSALLEE